MRRGFLNFVYVVACALLAALARPHAAAPDIVLYASDAVNVSGNWSRATDATAANGQTLVSVDQGWSTPNALLAVPATRSSSPSMRPRARITCGCASRGGEFEIQRLGVRTVLGRGRPAGRRAHPTGTTSGLFVNLQSCNGCALSDWGWIDGAYWLSQRLNVSFSHTGTHTLRVQTREDGVQFDEIVLSPSTYLSQSPGQVMNDQTKILKPPAPPGGSTPFTGTPLAIPGAIQASDFDNGGEGVAYHDTVSGNAGGAYRQTDVDLEASSDGGNDVGWMAAGEWLNYTRGRRPGTYTATFRVASPAPGGTFHLEMNGADVTGPIVIPLTGGWQTWQSVTKTVTLTAGTQIARLVIDAGGQGGTVGNITSMTFTPATVQSPPSQSSPYGGTPAAVPGVIQAENFDNGGEGVAYHDSTSGNAGGSFRSCGRETAGAAPGRLGLAGEGERSVNRRGCGQLHGELCAAAAGQGGNFHLRSTARTARAVSPS
jgi:hypothetical protein